jgi:hypothetical protein
MFLALILKQVGEYVLERETFMSIADNFEIVASKNAEGNIILNLIEDEALVKNIRAERLAADAKAKIVVPA